MIPLKYDVSHSSFKKAVKVEMRRSCFLLGLFTSLWVPLSYAQVRFTLVTPETVKQRLDLYKGDDLTRERALLNSFSGAGCPSNDLSEQPVKKRKEPNVICVLPGETDEVILVGAHFDHVSKGNGVVDNWSGASLLPSLFQSLLGSKRKHTFVFVGFTGEEDGFIGSEFYVKQLSQLELSRIRLMVTLDTLGLGATKVWVSHSDKEAVGLLGGVASATKMPLAAMNIDGFGDSDEAPFAKKKIKTITIHSLTSETTGVLHTKLDDITAVKFQDYYETYHLLAAYLVVLDSQLSSGLASSVAPAL